MPTFSKVAAYAVCAGLLSTYAYAQAPSLSTKTGGGTFIVIATNPSNQGFNCHAKWTVTGSQLDGVVTKEQTATFFVAPHVSGKQVVISPTPGLSNVSNTSVIELSCP